MKKVRPILLTLIIMLLAGCGGTVKNELAGTSWELVSYAGILPIEGKTMTAIFEDQQVSGSASCNHYFGSYQIKGDQFSIEGLGWTEMACLDPDGIMEQEQIIMRMLSRSKNFSIEGKILSIKTTDGISLIFQAQEALD